MKAVINLDPRQQRHNPAMFVITMVSALTTALFIWMLFGTGNGAAVIVFGMVTVWLWLTIFLVNFVQALAEGYSQGRVKALCWEYAGAMAKKLCHPECRDNYELIPATDLCRGDVVLVEAGETIPADGEVVEGLAPVDERVLFGQHTPIVHEAGGERPVVTGGTRVLADWLIVRINTEPGQNLVDRMANTVKAAIRRSPSQKILLNSLLAGLAIIFLFVIAPRFLFFSYDTDEIVDRGMLTIATLVALLAASMPITSGAFLGVIDVAKLGHLLQRNVIILSLRAMDTVEKVNVLLLDKSAAIVPNRLRAVAFIPLGKTGIAQLAGAARLAAATDETPEGQSIVALAEKHVGSGHETKDTPFHAPTGVQIVLDVSQAGLSGVDFNGMLIRRGAPEAIAAYVQAYGYPAPPELGRVVKRVADQGGISQVITLNGKVIGVVHLKDEIKKGLRERLARLRQMGIKTILTTGSTPLTTAPVAVEVGADDFLSTATAAAKSALIHRYQNQGQRVAITGLNADDVSALIEADVALAMNSGVAPVRQVADMINLDSDSGKLVELVEIGKQWQVTRRVLTIFSMVNDVAKYLILVLAVLASVHPAWGALNFMRLTTPTSAILAAIIFNALLIIALTPLARRGVSYQLLHTPLGQRSILLACGLGGFIAPVMGIKLIDLTLAALGLV